MWYLVQYPLFGFIFRLGNSPDDEDSGQETADDKRRSVHPGLRSSVHDFSGAKKERIIDTSRWTVTRRWREKIIMPIELTFVSRPGRRVWNAKIKFRIERKRELYFSRDERPIQRQQRQLPHHQKSSPLPALPPLPHSDLFEHDTQNNTVTPAITTRTRAPFWIYICSIRHCWLAERLFVCAWHSWGGRPEKKSDKKAPRAEGKQRARRLFYVQCSARAQCARPRTSL